MTGYPAKMSADYDLKEALRPDQQALLERADYIMAVSIIIDVR